MTYRIPSPRPPDERIPSGGKPCGDGWLHPPPHHCKPPGFFLRLFRWIRPGRTWTCAICFRSWRVVIAANPPPFSAWALIEEPKALPAKEED